MNTAWMRRYTDPESNTSAKRDLWRHAGLTLVTDRSRLLCVEGDGGTPLDDAPDSWANAVIHVAGEAKRPDAGATTLGDLWAWADRVERIVCPACAGTGLVNAMDGNRVIGPHEQAALCPECDGRLWVFPWDDDRPDRDTVQFGAVPLDRNQLAWWLAAELGTPDTVVEYQVGNLDRSRVGTVALFGPNWKLILAGYQWGADGAARCRPHPVQCRAEAADGQRRAARAAARRASDGEVRARRQRYDRRHSKGGAQQHSVCSSRGAGCRHELRVGGCRKHRRVRTPRDKHQNQQAPQQ
jgi:hypothetical protein